MDTLSNQIVRVAETFAEASGLKLTAVSKRVFGDHRVLPGLVAGESSPTIRRADRALAWFSGNWPADAVWPSDVPRPSPAEVAS